MQRAFLSLWKQSILDSIRHPSGASNVVGTVLCLGYKAHCRRRQRGERAVEKTREASAENVNGPTLFCVTRSSTFAERYKLRYSETRPHQQLDVAVKGAQEGCTFFVCFGGARHP